MSTLTLSVNRFSPGCIWRFSLHWNIKYPCSSSSNPSTLNSSTESRRLFTSPFQTHAKRLMPSTCSKCQWLYKVIVAGYWSLPHNSCRFFILSTAYVRAIDVRWNSFSQYPASTKHWKLRPPHTIKEARPKSGKRIFVVVCQLYDDDYRSKTKCSEGSRSLIVFSVPIVSYTLSYKQPINKIHSWNEKQY